MLDTSEDPYVPSQRSVHAAGGPMGWSTKVAIGGVIHGSQVNRHPPHHPPSSYSLVGARLEHFTLIVRMYGFEGEAGREGEGFTRTRESSHRRFRVSHVSNQTNDDEHTISVVEEGLAAYNRTGTYTDRREMSGRAARLSSIL